jgi:putative colanic acid biosynthesis glycosyltransferase
MEIDSDDEYALGRKPILSVVTITRNDPIGLRRTIQSLRNISHEFIQVVIVDGSDISSIDSSNPLEHFGFHNLHIIREPDQGIYDAMNKGLKCANGKFVWFLNGGDINLLKSIRFLLEYISDEPLPVLLGGYRIVKRGLTLIRKPSKLSKLNHGLPTSHQAIFYPSDAFKEIGFDLRYKMCADYASLATFHVKGQKFQFLNKVVAEFNLDGYSGQYQTLLRSEAREIQENILGLPRRLIFLSQIRHHFSARLRSNFNKFGGLH